jgi:predicted O-methyltransferase YrrM
MPGMEYHAHNWQNHIMGPSSGNSPFIEFEEPESEEQAILGALKYLRSAEILSSSSYDTDAFDRFCDHVKAHFEIPWTGISPRMRRMIYTINALHRPEQLVCAGIFCGYTFICNAGASIGPGSCYKSQRLVGLEILPTQAALAKRNVERFCPGYGHAVICADAAEWLSKMSTGVIDLLYLDAKAIDFDPRAHASRPAERSSEYLKILHSALPRLRTGSLVLAHNSVNAADEISDYLAFVREQPFRCSVNLVIDDAGLEVSLL